MSKYKLIKEYPNSPKLGSVIIDTNPNNGAKDCWFSEDWGKSGSKAFFIPKSTNPDKHPEFWEEIVDKKSLFTTEDGVNIFENDIVHWVKLYGEFKYLYPLRFIKEHLMMDFISGYRVFSTEKAAKDWIDLNSPKYSLQDIENAVKSFNWGPFTFDMLKNALNNK